MDAVSRSSSSSLPRRRTPLNVARSIALENGGSNVLSALMPGVITDSIICPGSAEPRRRAAISISGSSGTDVDVSRPQRGGGWIHGSSRRRRRSACARRESSRRSSPSPLPRATSTARTSAPRYARRCCPKRPRSSASLLLPRPRAGPPRAPAGHRHAAACCCWGTSTPSSRTPTIGRSHRVGEQLVGSGAVDMKGGDSSRSASCARFAPRPELFAELALLLVFDEEWRTAELAHVERFAGWDAAPVLRGRRTGGRGRGRRRAAQGGRDDRRRPPAAAARTRARPPIAAATRCSRWPPPPRPSPPATTPGPGAPDLRADLLRSGDAFNVVPGAGELFCDLRADDLDAIQRVLPAIPAEVGGVRLDPELIGRWPGMRSEAAVARRCSSARARLLGRRSPPLARRR